MSYLLLYYIEKGDEDPMDTSAKTDKTEPEIIAIDKPMTAAGLVMTTGMKTIFKDVAKILRKYMDCKSKYGLPHQKEPWEYVSLSKNFMGDHTWDYYTGHVVARADHLPEVFQAFEVPAGSYAVFHVRPKFKFLLGPQIGKMKKYIYTKWLPASQYDFAGCEYEYNNEEMFRMNPSFVDLYVAVKAKDSST